MGRRRDKGMAVARYLTGETGIPFIRWDYGGLHAPHPLRLDLQTEATNWKYWKAVHALGTEDISAVIRYDAYIESIPDAVVTTKLATFTRMLATLNETGNLEIRHRNEEN